MTDATKLVPDGISHETDLSGLSPAERKNHHVKQLRSTMFHGARDAAASYKQEHPDAADLRTLIDTTAYQPKPPEYFPAWRRLVGLWLTDDAALAQPQGQDVDWLNREIGAASFDRNRFLSKPLSSTERKHAAEVFETKGLMLPPTVRKKSEVKGAAKAGKAKARPGATPFGYVGTRTGDTLTIGQRTFRIVQYKGRDCIRVTADGITQRIYLPHLLELLAVGGTTAPTPPSCTCTVRELVSGPVSPPFGPMAGTSETTSPEDLSRSEGDRLPLTDRIARLTAVFTAPPPSADPLDIDPLEL